MTDEEFIADALERAEDALAAGAEPSPAGLCRDRPWLAERVADDLRRLREFERAWGTAPAADGRDRPAHRPGDVIAESFRLEALVGHGAHGEVWRGTHLSSGKPVAVKLSRTIPAAGQPAALAVEAGRNTNLTHPNIVPLYFAGGSGGSKYLVSQLVDGETLAARIARERPSIPEARRIARDIAAALTYAHEREIIHRDVKPENLLIGSNGHVYVADFGIAVSRWQLGRSRSGATGSAPYMAPEQFDPAAPLDERCDLYAVGVVLFEMLTRTHPFPAGDAAARLGRLTGREPPRPSAANPDVPAELDEIVARCLAPEPAGRFGSARELLLALGGDQTPLRRPAVRALREGTWDDRMARLRLFLAAGPIPPEAFPAVIALLAADRPEYRDEVADTLASEGAAAVPALVSALSTPGPAELRLAVVGVLERIGPAAGAAVPVLSRFVEVPVIGSIARRALAAIRPPATAARRAPRPAGRIRAAVRVVRVAAALALAWAVLFWLAGQLPGGWSGGGTRGVAFAAVMVLTGCLTIGWAALRPSQVSLVACVVVALGLGIGTMIVWRVAEAWDVIGGELPRAISPGG